MALNYNDRLLYNDLVLIIIQIDTQYNYQRYITIDKRNPNQGHDLPNIQFSNINCTRITNS